MTARQKDLKRWDPAMAHMGTSREINELPHRPRTLMMMVLLNNVIESADIANAAIVKMIKEGRNV